MARLDGLQLGFVAGTLGQGGAERQLYYILDALVRSGAVVRLFTLTRGEYWEDRIRDLGVEVTWIGRFASKVARVGAVIRQARRQRLDLVQSQHFYTNLYAVAAARAIGAPEIGALRNDGRHEVSETGAVLGRLSLRIPKLLAANSRQAIRNANSLGVPADRLHLLPNVVDVGEFSPRAGAAGNEVRLLAAARLVSQKRHDRFLRLIAELRDRGHGNVRGIVVGDGPMRGELEAHASALGLLPGLVEFRGASTSMNEVYREADALVLTSDFEGTPNVILEAMASGLPVVAPRVGGVPDTIEDGRTGLLFDSGDEAALIHCVESLVASAEVRARLGASARHLIEATRAPDRLPTYLTELYTAALA